MLVPELFMAFMLLALEILQIFWTYYIASSFIEVNVSSKLAKHTYDWSLNTWMILEILYFFFF